MNKLSFSLISAITKNNGIGYNGGIPWKLKNELKWFKKITTATTRSEDFNIVIMGYKTWQSIGQKPLKNRVNVILSRRELPTYDFSNYYIDTNLSENSKTQAKRAKFGNILQSRDYFYIHDLERFLCSLHEREIPNINKIFIIGGQQLYEKAIKMPECEELFITHIKKGDYICDTYFPEIEQNKFEVKESLYKESNIYEIIRYVSKSNLTPSVNLNNIPNNGEHSYLNILKTLLGDNLNDRKDRTNVGTRSLFGSNMRFSLENNTIPLLTTKKMYWKGIVEELLWFLRGSTNVNELKQKNVHIWDGNSTKEFLNSVGLENNVEGDIGPTYGYNFRHFGGDYKNISSPNENIVELNKNSGGVDQIKNVLDMLKNNPFSRRIIITLWNPLTMNQVALPPCLFLYQFYVSEDSETGQRYLSCSIYQRSGDIGLGVPFNIASASLLTHILAKLSGMKPKELIHNIGDNHVYLNHVDSLKKQLKRNPRPFPKLIINDNKTYDKVEDFEYKDFKLVGYYPYDNIKMEMAV